MEMKEICLLNIRTSTTIKNPFPKKPSATITETGQNFVTLSLTLFADMINKRTSTLSLAFQSFGEISSKIQDRKIALQYLLKTVLFINFSGYTLILFWKVCGD